MVQDSVLIRKLISILFFSVLIIFLLYISLEKILSKVEFKKRLRFVKDQLLWDLLKEDFVKIWDLLVLDEFDQIESETKIELNNLKKIMLSELSKQDLKQLEWRINWEFMEREKKLNRLILIRYRDAIKSLNNRMVYLKNEMDSFKIMLENKDERKEERKEESSVQPKNEAPSNDLQNLLVDRWYLLKDMELLKNEIKFQKYRNNIFIISLILLFSFLLILVAFVL